MFLVHLFKFDICFFNIFRNRQFGSINILLIFSYDVIFKYICACSL